MYSKNRRGPKTVPWGTPEVTGSQDDCDSFTTTRCRDSCLLIWPSHQQQVWVRSHMSSQNESHVVEGKDVVVRQKSADAGVDNIFKYFTADGGEWDWSVVFGKFPCILFVQCEDVSDMPVCRNYTWVQWLVKYKGEYSRNFSACSFITWLEVICRLLRVTFWSPSQREVYKHLEKLL